MDSAPAQTPQQSTLLSRPRGGSHILQKSNGFIFLSNTSNFFLFIPQFLAPSCRFLGPPAWGEAVKFYSPSLWVSHIHSTSPWKDSHHLGSVHALCWSVPVLHNRKTSPGIMFHFYVIFLIPFPVPAERSWIGASRHVFFLD